MRGLLSGPILLLALSGPAFAQAVLRGSVIADSSRRAIDGATVAVSGGNRSARTDAAGRFALDGLAGGVIRLAIRAIGYEPLDVDAEIGATDTVDVEFRLKASAVRLPTIEVTGAEAPPLTAKMEQFERRRRLGFGSFFGRAELATWEAQPVSLPLRRLAGIRLVARPSCGGGGFAAASGRGGNTVSRCATDRRVVYAPACYLAVFIDGIRIWDPSMDDPPDVDQYLTRSLEGIEVYRGAGQLPADLQQTGTACGALVLWTRTGDAPPGPRRPPPALP